MTSFINMTYNNTFYGILNSMKNQQRKIEAAIVFIRGNKRVGTLRLQCVCLVIVTAVGGTGAV